MSSLRFTESSPRRPHAASRLARATALSVAALLLSAVAGTVEAQSSRDLVYDWVQGSLVNAAGAPAGAIDGIDRRIAVTVRVKNFNYFRYSPALRVSEEKLESYAFLDNLWRGLLGFDLASLADLVGGMGILGGGAPTFDDHYNETRYVMYRLGWLMRSRASEHTAVALPWAPALRDFRVLPGEFPGCAAAPAPCTLSFATLVTLLDNTKSALDTYVAGNRGPGGAIGGTELTKYFALLEEHAKFLEMVARFEATLDYIENGKPLVVGAKPAGTRVTVALVPQTMDGSDYGKPASFTYFVESELPAVFSFGYLVSSLDDFSFEKVRLDGADVFQLQGSEETTYDLAAFLSLRPRWAWLNDEGTVAVAATLGTSLRDPGSRLAIGPSLLLHRWALTTGVVTAKTESPLDPVDPGDGESLGRLFRSVAETRDWAWFLSLSFSPFE